MGYDGVSLEPPIRLEKEKEIDGDECRPEGKQCMLYVYSICA